jgi:quercetin dioxygenase-like cupin family protein
MPPERLDAARHTAYELAPDLLLVSKPQDHREGEHTHGYALRLRVVRGRLAVQMGAGEAILDDPQRPYTIEAGAPHATHAIEPTWVIVVRIGG